MHTVDLIFFFILFGLFFFLNEGTCQRKKKIGCARGQKASAENKENLILFVTTSNPQGEVSNSTAPFFGGQSGENTAGVW